MLYRSTCWILLTCCIEVLAGFHWHAVQKYLLDSTDMLYILEQVSATAILSSLFIGCLNLGNSFMIFLFFFLFNCHYCVNYWCCWGRCTGLETRCWPNGQTARCTLPRWMRWWMMVSGIVREPGGLTVHPPTPTPQQEPSTMVPKCTLGCPEHNLTCSPNSHWDALELQPFAQGYPLAFTQALTERRSLMRHLNHLYIIFLWHNGPDVL